MKQLIAILLFCYSTSLAQSPHYKHDKQLTNAIKKIVKQCGLDSSYQVDEPQPMQVSVAVIELKNTAVIGGVHLDQFIYPASVYKMYVAMEVLNQVSQGLLSLSTLHIVKTPNDVDRTKEILSDPRPLLRHGDTVTINYLLDLMITRSDNTAANCLIDKAGRKNINNSMELNGWRGSEVTRKFLSRRLEDPGYDTIRGTVTSARHAAEFMLRIEKNKLVNPWVSKQMKALLGRQLDDSKLAAGLPPNVMFSHKTGWWSFFTHDAGIVDNGETSYVLAVFTPIRESDLNGRLASLAQNIHALMLKRSLKN